uniref:Uncharacterized protein n=1 Tax=Oryza glumipatula TaxID=40148 RepID=A0A0D9ZAP7_9ORYZ
MNPSYRRISESDDEFIHFVLPTLGDSSQSSYIRRPMHTSKLTGGCRVHEILTGHERLCKRNFRMEWQKMQPMKHFKIGFSIVQIQYIDISKQCWKQSQISHLSTFVHHPYTHIQS